MASAQYDEAANRWRVHTERGETYRRQIPDYRRRLPVHGECSATFPGLKDFKGDWYHTGQWPHEGVDFTGKRVGMIGTGSTGIQAAPVIAAQAEHLTVFQRTANYSVPARNAPLTPEFRQYVKQNADEIRDDDAQKPINGMGFTDGGAQGGRNPARGARDDL